MLQDLKEIEQSLEAISKELDIQMSTYTIDNDKFHESLIELISKYPDYKELIQFIVSINDKLVTTHILSRDIFYETIKGLIQQKRILIKKLYRDYEEKYELKKPKESIFIRIFEYIKSNKIVLITVGVSVSFTLLMVGVFLVPTETLEALKLLKGFTGK